MKSILFLLFFSVSVFAQEINVVNAANYGRKIAPNSYVTAFGNFTSNCDVTISNYERKIHVESTFCSATQVNFIMPTVIGATTVFIGNNKPKTVDVSAVAPGIFTMSGSGFGVPAANVLRTRNNHSYYEILSYLEDGEWKALPIEFNTGADRVYLILYGTGIRYRQTLANVTAKIGGIDTFVSYAGAHDSTNLDQINVEIPRELIGRGKVAVEIFVEGQRANITEIFVK